MSEREPPDWALPSWDAVPTESEEGRGRLRPVAPGPAPGGQAPGGGPAPGGPVPGGGLAPGGPVVSPAPAPPGTFGVRILGVSEVTRSIRGAIRSDPRLSDL